jgi:hypothetical protein
MLPPVRTTYSEEDVIEDKQLDRAVKSLGTTERGIARKLKAAGIKGEPGDPTCCPIAVYLKGQFPDEAVEVGGRTITVNGATSATPDGANAFITEFDEYNYPELVEHHKDCSGLEIIDGTETWGGISVSCGCGRVDRNFWSEATGFRAAARAYLARAQRGFA